LVLSFEKSNEFYVICFCDPTHALALHCIREREREMWKKMWNTDEIAINTTNYIREQA
jgi:hypothetical protein